MFLKKYNKRKEKHILTLDFEIATNSKMLFWLLLGGYYGYVFMDTHEN